MDTKDLHLPATRKDAQAADSMFFFTGRACCHGHISKRRTSNNACQICARDRQNAANARPEVKAKRRVIDRQRFIDNPEYFLAKSRRYQAAKRQQAGS